MENKHLINLIATNDSMTMKFWDEYSLEDSMPNDLLDLATEIIQNQQAIIRSLKLVFKDIGNS